MFRFVRLFAALGFALAAFAAMDLPASAQGTVREHRGGDTPPAPSGGVRDHRTTDAPAPTPRPARTTLAKNPVQWEIRNVAGIVPEQPYSIFNLRRAELDLSSELTFKETSARDTTGWGLNGGDFVFKRDTKSTNVRDHRVVRDGEFLAIYNTKTKRYLYMDIPQYPVWEDRPQYVWMVKKITPVGEGRSGSVQFALFNTQARKWLMICQGERLKIFQNPDLLCLYDDTFKPAH